MITRSRLRSLLDYNPDTGVFTRRVTVGGRLAGTVAGTITEDGYVRIRVDGRFYRAHRLAFLWMTGEFPDLECDHEDQDRSNNRWANLRQATKSQNNQNRSVHSNNTSGHVGVTWHRRMRKWVVRIGVDGRKKWIGGFEDKEEAIAAYANAKAALHPFAVNGGAVVVTISEVAP